MSLDTHSTAHLYSELSHPLLLYTSKNCDHTSGFSVKSPNIVQVVPFWLPDCYYSQMVTPFSSDSKGRAPRSANGASGGSALIGSFEESFTRRYQVADSVMYCPIPGVDFVSSQGFIDEGASAPRQGAVIRNQNQMHSGGLLTDSTHEYCLLLSGLNCICLVIFLFFKAKCTTARISYGILNYPLDLLNLQMLSI